MELTYDGTMDIADIKYTSSTPTGNTLPPETYKVTDLNLMLNSFFPNEVKVSITIDDKRLRSNLTTNSTIRFSKNSSFSTILGSIQLHSGILGYIGRFNQLILGTYKSEKPINIAGVVKSHSKCDCNNGSIVNGIRESILFSVALENPPGQKKF